MKFFLQKSSVVVFPRILVLLDTGQWLWSNQPKSWTSSRTKPRISYKHEYL